MSALPPLLLAQEIDEAERPDDFQKILARISSLNPSSEEFLQKYKNKTPLNAALYKRLNDVASAIMDKISEATFLKNFMGENQKDQSDATDFLSLSIELMDCNKVPVKFVSLISDFAKRQILSLLAGMSGPTNFHDIPCYMVGHYNYKYVSRVLFDMLNVHLQEIMKRLSNNLEGEDKGDKKILVNAIAQAIDMMQRLQQTSRIRTDIYPVLVGTISGYTQKSKSDSKEKKESKDKSESRPDILHAEGFVLYRKEKFLFVERANWVTPGVQIYKIDEQFNWKRFDIFLEKAENSASGVDFGEPITSEEYTGCTTASGHLTLFDSISMTKQNETDCTVASSEGIFLATLYCWLVKEGLEHSKASALSRKYIKLILEQNMLIEIVELKSKAEAAKDQDLLNFIQQLENYKPSEEVEEKEEKEKKDKEKEKDVRPSAAQFSAGEPSRSPSEPLEKFYTERVVDLSFIGNPLGKDAEGKPYFTVEEPPGSDEPPDETLPIRTQGPLLKPGIEIRGTVKEYPSPLSPILAAPQLSLPESTPLLAPRNSASQPSISESTPLLAPRRSEENPKPKDKKGCITWLYEKCCGCCLRDSSRKKEDQDNEHHDDSPKPPHIV